MRSTSDLDDNMSHPDLYQMLAYVVAADLPSGMLIYPSKGEAEAEIANRRPHRANDRDLYARHLRRAQGLSCASVATPARGVRGCGAYG